MHLLKVNSDGSPSLTNFIGGKIPSYAILSHTWEADSQEVTFEDMVNGVGIGKVGYKKIQFCGEQAQKDGLQYFWVDSCCIDKSSSAELSEAINSMFRWYRNAAKCYVYLSDVSTGHSDQQHTQFSQRSYESAFRQSRWFTRGWTLQELLAPLSVEFFSQEGELLGDKKSLEHQIHEITGITVRALQGNPMSEFRVTERFSWATKRETTIEEDQAYCLLGIFDIHLPAIYGEGKEKAFHRLRKEISAFDTGARLLTASLDGHVKVVKLLLENGADVMAANNAGETPLLVASRNGYVEVVKLLLESGANVTVTNNSGVTPLLAASRFGRVEVVKLLLENRADVMAANNAGETPLLVASRHHHIKVVKLLLENKAIITVTNNSGATPLLAASRFGCIEVVKLLLKNGADITAVNNAGETPLLVASLNGHIEVVKLLLENGADIAVTNNSGATPLLAASRFGYIKVVELLLKNGADIIAANNAGETPLLVASLNGHVKVVKLLLENGADITVATNSRETL